MDGRIRKTLAALLVATALLVVLIPTLKVAVVRATGTVAWTADQALPFGMFQQRAATNGHAIYLAGGVTCHPTCTNGGEVLWAPIGVDGTLGPWTNTTSMPQGPAIEHQFVYAEGHLFILGGYQTGTANWSAAILADGSVGQWVPVTPLPAPRMRQAAFVSHGSIYLIAGADGSGPTESDVWRAHVNPDGTLGAWLTEAPLPTTLQAVRAVEAGGFVFAAGGEVTETSSDSDVVFSARIADDGAISTWTAATPLPNPMGYIALTAIGRHLVISPSRQSDRTADSRTLVADVAAGGTLGPWTNVASHPLPVSLNSTISIGRDLYTIGGATNTGDVVSNVFHARTSGLLEGDPRLPAPVRPTATGSVIAWGLPWDGRTEVPVGLTDVVAVAAGDGHTLALRSDGTVVSWGYDGSGQADVPAGLTDVVAVSASSYDSLALKSDGTVVAWGDNSHGQNDIPPGLSDVVAISAGGGFNLALRNDGTIVAWGDDAVGSTDVPSGLSGVVAIAAANGGAHSLALKSDGTLVAWGFDNYGQADVPTNLTGVVEIHAGAYHNVAVKGDKTAVAWGLNDVGQIDVPSDVATFDAIVAGAKNNLVIRDDRTVSGWGWNAYGQLNFPAGLANVIAVAAGAYHSVALVGPGQAPTLPVTFTVHVPGAAEWFDTGIDIPEEVGLQFNATGHVHVAGSDTYGKTPAGCDVCIAPADSTLPPGPFLAPGLLNWSLVGRIASGDPFQVGDAIQLAPTTSGRLFLTIDDNFFGDNTGDWTVVVTLWPADEMPPATTTTLAADVNPASTLPVTFTATITSTGGTPSGVVSFVDGWDELGDAVVDANGVATLTTSSLQLTTQPIQAIYRGNPSFAPSSSAILYETVLGPQSIMFDAVSDVLYGAPPFALSATASSGLVVGFASSGPCSVSGSTLTVTGVGSCSVTASQPGNAEYAAAPNAIRTFSIGNALTAVANPSIWVGLKNSDDVGVKFDLKAEVYLNGSLVRSGTALSVAAGSSGFNNAKLDTIALGPLSAVAVPSGSTLALKLSVRNACTGSAHNSGTARLWFNDAAANSRFGSTLNGGIRSYFLTASNGLLSAAGPGPKLTIDVSAGAKCGPFAPFGTWTTTVP